MKTRRQQAEDTVYGLGIPLWLHPDGRLTQNAIPGAELIEPPKIAEPAPHGLPPETKPDG